MASSAYVYCTAVHSASYPNDPVQRTQIEIVNDVWSRQDQAIRANAPKLSFSHARATVGPGGGTLTLGTSPVTLWKVWNTGPNPAYVDLDKAASPSDGILLPVGVMLSGSVRIQTIGARSTGGSTTIQAFGER